jgi:hypothetical protein
MPLELAVWRIDQGLVAVPSSGIDLESRLQDLLDQDITVADPGWMVIRREIDTGFGSRADLLAIDSLGNLVLLELKRDQTPREVVAQALEYGAWVAKLRSEDLPIISGPRSSSPEGRAISSTRANWMNAAAPIVRLAPFGATSRAA